MKHFNASNSAEPFHQCALDAARQAGALLMDLMGSVTAIEKSPRNLVTEADMRSQDLITGLIQKQFPDHHFIAEESKTRQLNWRDGFCWIIDPVDGTMNFVHRLPSFSISIGLFHNGQPIMGVVFDPILDECYSALRGQGATLNAQPIRPSDCESLHHSLLVSSFPATVTPDCPELKRFTAVVQKASMRRLGSAALNLCYVASGRLDGYWASTLHLWDIAAGILIAQEAGAIGTHISGTPIDYDDPQICVVSTRELHSQLIPLLQVDS